MNEKLDGTGKDRNETITITDAANRLRICERPVERAVDATNGVRKTLSTSRARVAVPNPKARFVRRNTDPRMTTCRPKSSGSAGP
jgi:hypothetical protein